MGCRRIQKRLKSFSDGEAGSFRKGAVERHLAKCDRCRQALEDLHALEHLLEAYEGIEPPEHGLAGLVVARARKERGSSVRSLSASPFGLPLGARLFSPYGWATAGLFFAGLLAGQLIAASIRQMPGQDEQSEQVQQVFNLEIFSEIPPDSLEQRYWEALSAGQWGNG